MSYRLCAAGQTDVGRVRTNNEDALLIREVDGLFAVADGMGGHERGEWASARVIEHLAEAGFAADFDRRLEQVAAAIHAANAEVRGASAEAGQTMGSTVAVLHIADEGFAAFWVGDSRVYLLRGGSLVRLTRDHTHVSQMLDEGLLEPSDALDHPMRHALSRAVGVEDAIEIDAVRDEIMAGDIFMLCSDGLTGLVSDREIATILGSEIPAHSVPRLIELALARGGQDNVTVIVVACEQATMLRFAALANGEPL